MLIYSLPVPVGDAPSAQIIRGDLDLDPVTGEYADPVHAHLARAVREHLVPVLQLYPEHRVRQRLHNGSLEDNRILLRFWQVNLLLSAFPYPTGQVVQAKAPKARPNGQAPQAHASAGPEPVPRQGLYLSM